MTCLLCKGKMVEDTTTHVVDLKNCIVIIRNVPCFKCTQCGEVTYTGVVMKQLEKILDTLENTLTEIAIINYPDRVA